MSEFICPFHPLDLPPVVKIRVGGRILRMEVLDHKPEEVRELAERSPCVVEGLVEEARKIPRGSVIAGGESCKRCGRKISFQFPAP